MVLAGVLLMGCFGSSGSKVGEPKSVVSKSVSVNNARDSSLDEKNFLAATEIFPLSEDMNDLKALLSIYKYKVSTQNKEKFLAALPSGFEDKNGMREYDRTYTEGIHAIVRKTDNETVDIYLSTVDKALRWHTDAFLAQVFGSNVVGDIQSEIHIPISNEGTLKELRSKYGENVQAKKNKGDCTLMLESTLACAILPSDGGNKLRKCITVSKPKWACP
jgi:hypothetical protein